MSRSASAAQGGRGLIALLVSVLLSVASFAAGYFLGRQRAHAGKGYEHLTYEKLSPARAQSQSGTDSGSDRHVAEINRRLEFYEEVNKSNPPKTVGEGSGQKEPQSLADLPKITVVTDGQGGTEAKSDDLRGGYYIQVAAFREMAPANALTLRLLAKGYQAYIETSAQGPERYFRVKVGKFGSRQEALRLVEQLKREGFNSIVKKD